MEIYLSYAAPCSFCPLAGRPREVASDYPHSSLQPDLHLDPHTGHLLSLLEVEKRPLLPRAAYLPLVPGGDGLFHPFSGNLVLLLT